MPSTNGTHTHTHIAHTAFLMLHSQWRTKSLAHTLALRRQTVKYSTTWCFISGPMASPFVSLISNALGINECPTGWRKGQVIDEVRAHEKWPRAALHLGVYHFIIRLPRQDKLHKSKTSHSEEWHELDNGVCGCGFVSLLCEFQRSP